MKALYVTSIENFSGKTAVLLGLGLCVTALVAPAPLALALVIGDRDGREECLGVGVGRGPVQHVAIALFHEQAGQPAFGLGQCSGHSLSFACAKEKPRDLRIRLAG